ncbi:nitrous oxide reductase accessory protein NosL [Halorientalis pallida]|uniref:NosL protein n=1 Tax=Halorientalis pallida TaxID=2479928 RepID=A0A498KVG6_9EURY|nr:nitrous oxide reductase accessory protein NosL [Halorientalis pallida]RXK49229.1 hypothetical protein EAF64_09925 [Halorientalis pallida]
MTNGDSRRVDRRTAITLLAAGATVSLAGCSGGDGNGTDDTPAETTETSPDDETTTAPGEASLEPVDIPADATCAVCGMKAANFSDWNAQAVHEDDRRASFCTAGCATTYYAVPEEFAQTDAAVAALWVTDLETREFVDGTEAFFALETDSDRLEDPMRLNPAPFANRADAVAYVDAVEYLTEDDIVDLSAFDRALAEQYRGTLLE